MLEGIKKKYREWQNYRAFSARGIENNRIVFYSEGLSSQVHFEQILISLRDDYRQKIVYLTSDEKEKNNLANREEITSFYIGSGIVRTILFAFLKCRVLVMTMPDLQTFHIKRSAYPVHYVYIHHSIVSTHMIYRPAAFDHFDTIFCVGPHHVNETSARETTHKLRGKNLLQHGYGRLDKLLAEQFAQNHEDNNKHFVQVLVAPSWGENALLERHGGAFMKTLLEEGYHVTLRPHPQTLRLHANLIQGIREELDLYPNFCFEQGVESTDSLNKADVMISDWSGAALEFSFSRLKPVLFVDVPRKINNPDYLSLEIEPIEVSIRQNIGMVVPEEDLAQTGKYIKELMENADRFKDKIKQCREASVYNIGESGKAGAKELVRLLNA